VSDARTLTAEQYAAAKPYAIVVEWSDEDQAYIATAPDIRGCRTHGATRDEAARMGEEAVALALAAHARHGLATPEPRFTALDDAIYEREAIAIAARS
jgi:predicted RNase H-like HicB family nuclease